jgi:hypothetical protein
MQALLRLLGGAAHLWPSSHSFITFFAHAALCYTVSSKRASAHTHLPTHTNWIICLSEISSVISRAKKKRLSPMSFPLSDTVGYYGNFTCSTHISARE